jgi:hypothetical protein
MQARMSLQTGPAPPAVELPHGLDREVHVDRRQHTPWPRRVAITLLAVFLLAGLFGVFGQVSSVSHAEAPAASLTVDSPTRLRGGLIFTSVITLVTRQQLHDARLVLAPDWFNGMTLNATAPQSSQESSSAQGAIWDYGQIDAGVTTPIWISWQTNPTTVGSRRQDVLLYDGPTLILAVHRTVVVFP